MADRAAQINMPQEGEQPAPEEGLAEAPLLPQDVHTAVVANAVHSTRIAASVEGNSNGDSSRRRAALTFPAFFVVTAGPDLAVLSDPSKEGKQIRRVKKVCWMVFPLKLQ